MILRLVMALFLILAVLLGGCKQAEVADTDPGKGEIVVGYLEDLSGPGAATFRPQTDGGVDAFRYMNEEQDGILGHPVRTVVIDFKMDPALATSGWDRLKDEGYVSVYCDRRGGEMLGEPAGADIVSILQYTKQLPYVDPDKVCLFGHSMGGALTLIIIKSEPVAAAIVNSPAVMSIIGIKDPPGLGSGANVNRPEEITDSMIDVNLEKDNYRKISDPVLFVVGTADRGHLGMVKKSY